MEPSRVEVWQISFKPSKPLFFETLKSNIEVWTPKEKIHSTKPAQHAYRTTISQPFPFSGTPQWTPMFSPAKVFLRKVASLMNLIPQLSLAVSG